MGIDLVVNVFAARGLVNKAMPFTKQSPYCTIKIAGQKFKTNVNMNGGCEPEFNQEFKIRDVTLQDDFQIEVKAYHSNIPKQHLGVFGIKLEKAFQGSIGRAKWFKLKNVKKPNLDAGELRMLLQIQTTGIPSSSPQKFTIPFKSPDVVPRSRPEEKIRQIRMDPATLNVPIPAIQHTESSASSSSNGSQNSNSSKHIPKPHDPLTSIQSLINSRLNPLTLSPRTSRSPRSDEVDWTGYEDLKSYRKHYIYPSMVTLIRQVNTEYMKTMLGHYGGEHVMVKSLKVASEREALIKEVIALSKVDCPKILAFVGFYIDHSAGGLHCITHHALANPSTLRELLNRMGSRISYRNKLKYAIDVAEALAYMHEHRMMHRGIKAENVMLNRRKEAVLSGFGTCRDRTYDQTLTVGVGDIQWSAPEMLVDGEYAEKVDVYSYGVLLIELDTNEIPFKEESLKMSRTELSNSLVTGKLRPSPTESCPPPMKRVIDTCIQHDPSLRPTMFQVWTQLAQIEHELEMTF